MHAVGDFGFIVEPPRGRPRVYALTDPCTTQQFYSQLDALLRRGYEVYTYRLGRRPYMWRVVEVRPLDSYPIVIGLPGTGSRHDFNPEDITS